MEMSENSLFSIGSLDLTHFMSVFSNTPSKRQKICMLSGGIVRQHLSEMG